jgi:signal transduction histidine kinase
MARHKQSLWVPILIGVLAIVFTLAVLVAWNVIFTRYYVLATATRSVPELGVGYWLILSFGSLLLVLVVAVLVVFLVANVRQALYVIQQNAFVDSVTHELKSPLASLRLCLETLEARELSREQQAKFIGMMKGDVDRLRAFVEHVLEASRLEHEQRELSHEPTSVSSVVHAGVEQIRRRYGLAPSALVQQGPPEADDEPIMTDPVALETVVVNLLDNAVKYSRKPVAVVVTQEADAAWVRLRVRDEGIGIPRGELKRIFLRFYRVGRKGKGVPRGTGLGLYVVASLVKRLGGRIQASSDGQDRGSTFVVEIPRRAVTPEDRTGEAEPVLP